jgi:hypothetical protein
MVCRVGIGTVLFPDMKLYEGLNPIQEPTADPTPELQLLVKIL